MEENLQNKKPEILIGKKSLMEYTDEELAYFDGTGGRPMYVAVNGLIYDVTEERSWADGEHYGLPAGIDATYEFETCHFGDGMLDDLEIIGRLVP